MYQEEIEVENSGHTQLGLELLAEASNPIPSNASPLLNDAIKEKQELAELAIRKQELQKLKQQKIKQQYLFNKKIKKIAKKSRQRNR